MKKKEVVDENGITAKIKKTRFKMVESVKKLNETRDRASERIRNG